MAMLRTVVGAAVALLVVMAMVLEAQAVQCPSAVSYIVCRNALTVKGTLPDVACCNKVKEVLALGLDIGPKCLCDAMMSKTAAQFKVIKLQGLNLPKECQKLIGLKYIKNYPCAGSTVP